MKKLLFFCRRLPELTHAAYAAHLLERHAPLALRHHASLAGYSLDLVEQTDPDAPAIDSINALWYDTLEDFRERNYDSPAGERLVTEDHARFLGGADGYVTREAVELAGDAVPGARAPGSKRVYALACDDADRWLERSVPALLADRAIRGLVIDRIEENLYDTGPHWDLVCEIWRDAGAPERPLPCDPAPRRVAAYRTAEHVLLRP